MTHQEATAGERRSSRIVIDGRELTDADMASGRYGNFVQTEAGTTSFSYSGPPLNRHQRRRAAVLKGKPVRHAPR